MQAIAIVMREPGRIELDRIALIDCAPQDVIVESVWSGISSGTERLLFEGRMPHFPGMGYPLVPGYETAGYVVERGRDSQLAVGDAVFVPGSSGFQTARALFGATARHLVVPEARVVKLAGIDGPEPTLLALAATAYHAAPHGGASRPDLIVGHGVLGRLLARLAMLDGGPAPVVWETNAARRDGGTGYAVIDPVSDTRRDYRCICDASGDPGLLDTLIQHLAPGGEIILAGFYSTPLSFAFPPAFMREARLRIAAQFKPADLTAVSELVQSGRLSLAGLITHRAPAASAAAAYETAFTDQACLKMILDWRQIS